jgi:signal transduction histidine kinase
MSNPGKISIDAAVQTITDTGAPGDAAPLTGELLDIRIEDEGSGIEAEELKDIFKPFYSTKPDGTGLGLSIVKRIVDSRQWQITVARRDPVGVLFRLRIPLDQSTFSVQRHTSNE